MNLISSNASTTVYVGNLNFKTTSEDLGNFFEGAEIGNVVKVDLKFHPGAQQSKGWALVDFASPDSAQSCAEQLNGALLDERILTIRLDRKSGGNSNGMAGGGQNNYNNNNNNNNNNNYNNNYNNRGYTQHNNNRGYTQQQQRGGQGRGGGGGGGGGGRGGGGGGGNQVTFAPSSRLFVGNLPWSVDNSALMNIFQSYQPNAATVVFGRDGRSRGYGIVEFDSVEAATLAINICNGMDYSGRTLNVRYDASNKAPTPQQKQHGETGFNRSYEDTVYVGNLPWGITWQQLKDLFQQYSPEFVDVKQGPDGRSRGWGTVRFGNSETALEAIETFNGYELVGRTGPRCIEVRQDRGPNAGAQGGVKDGTTRSSDGTTTTTTTTTTTITQEVLKE